MLTYAHVCSRMPTYADVRMLMYVSTLPQGSSGDGISPHTIRIRYRMPYLTAYATAGSSGDGITPHAKSFAAYTRCKALGGRYAHVCSRMLTYAHVCSRMLTFVCGLYPLQGFFGGQVVCECTRAHTHTPHHTTHTYTRTRARTHTHTLSSNAIGIVCFCLRMLTYADTRPYPSAYVSVRSCLRMLTYSDVCGRMRTYACVC
jgi:hypothetical protein